MKKIIHMSDMHIGYDGNPGLDLKENLLKVINWIIFNKGNDAGNYVVVITGDLVEFADRGNYEQVNDCLEILRMNGFKDILIVPGNHDLTNKKHRSRDYGEIFNEVFFGRKKVKYPDHRIITDGGDEESIAFIGLNSMEGELPWEQPWWDFLPSVGELGEKQLRKLKTLLASNEIKKCAKRVVYLHHYPLFHVPTLKLKDAGALGEIIRNSQKNEVSVDGLLFGHYHLGMVMNGSSDWGVRHCYDAGTATGKPEPTWANRVLRIDFKAATRIINLKEDRAYELNPELVS